MPRKKYLDSKIYTKIGVKKSSQIITEIRFSDWKLTEKRDVVVSLALTDQKIYFPVAILNFRIRLRTKNH